MNSIDYISPIVTLISAPLLFGIITRVKSIFAGRCGAPLLQPYYDLFKLFQKGAVYSRTTSWIFRASPIIGLTCMIIALLILPQIGNRSFFSFDGDLFLFVYVLGVMRFFMIIAAIDTGSAFEGMGASREAFFSMLAEPVLMVALVCLVKFTGNLTLADAFTNATGQWSIATLLIGVAIFIVLLAENARIPVDDPNTHLELTMIHEAMVLDHSGPEFGWIMYSSAVKLWLFSAIFVQVIMPVHIENTLLRYPIMFFSIFLCAIIVGIVESIMARLRLNKVPQLLAGAGAFSLLAFLFAARGGV